METETKNSIFDDAETTDDTKIIEDTSIIPVIIEKIKESHVDTCEKLKDSTDTKITNIAIISLSENPSSSLKVESNIRESIDVTKDSCAASLNPTTSEKIFNTRETNFEIIKLVEGVKDDSEMVNKSFQDRENKKDDISSLVVETTKLADTTKILPSSSLESSKDKILEKTVTEVISGCSELPEIVETLENSRNIVETEGNDDIENGGDENNVVINDNVEDDENDGDEDDDDDDDDEDDEDDDEDDEIVEHEEEECPIRIEQPEVGIVGPPTAVRDIVNDEELGTTESSSLPASETRNNDITLRKNIATPDVAEWIERSRLSNDEKEKKSNIKSEKETTKRRKKIVKDVNAGLTIGPSRKSQKIVTSIIRRSIKCLNKMHAAAEYGSGCTTVKKLETPDKREEDSRGSPKVPQNRQNGAALPEETATTMSTTATAAASSEISNTERSRTIVKNENNTEIAETTSLTLESMSNERTRSRRRISSSSSIDEISNDSKNLTKKSAQTIVKSVVKNENYDINTRKRRSNDDASLLTNCAGEYAKKMCFEQRESFIDSLVGSSEKISAEELATRADELRAEVQALDELARAKELEWNEILSMRKLKEEAYLRIERRRQIYGYMENSSNGHNTDNIPPASLSLLPDWEITALATTTEITRATTATTTTIDDETMTRKTTTTTTTSTSRPISHESSLSSRDTKDSMEIMNEIRLNETRDVKKLDDSLGDITPQGMSKRCTTTKSLYGSRGRTSSPKQLEENGRKQQQQQQQQQQNQQIPRYENVTDEHGRHYLRLNQPHPRFQLRNPRLSDEQKKQQQQQQSLDNRQIGEGRQGPIVDVRSIIADYRLRHPETVPKRYDSKKDSPTRQRENIQTTAATTTTTATTPSGQSSTSTNTKTSGLINVRRGRRMRNSVNIGLSAGGAMVETTTTTTTTTTASSHNQSIDSRPSSTDSCKSTNERAAIISGDVNNSMSFKDVLVQFAKLSQQQGEPVKTPQNYPDVTLHPVAPTTVTINSSSSQQMTTTGSLLHGILTKSQSPRPTTFSPTLARLLTAPERDRNNAPTTITPVNQQNIQTQHLLQTYQGSNPVSISDLLSSSKARTEITITPVVTPIAPMHTSQSNSLVQVDDVEEENSMMDDRDSRLGSGGRDNREERDSPPRCQGCQERAAQFVCAGCGNQWYCSRDCQVAAWDEHSEVCSG